MVPFEYLWRLAAISYRTIDLDHDQIFIYSLLSFKNHPIERTSQNNKDMIMQSLLCQQKLTNYRNSKEQS